MTFDDVLDSIRGTVISRIRNPFLGAFALSWVGLNWEYVYVTLFVASDKLPVIALHELDALKNRGFWFPEGARWPDKITYIRHGLEDGWCQLLWYPVLAGIVLLATANLLGPVSTLFVDWMKQLHRKWDSKLLKVKYYPKEVVDKLAKRLTAVEEENRALEAKASDALDAKNNSEQTQQNLLAQVGELRAANAENTAKTAQSNLEVERLTKELKAAEERVESVERALSAFKGRDAAKDVIATLGHHPDDERFGQLFQGAWVKDFNHGSETFRVAGNEYILENVTPSEWELRSLRNSRGFEIVYFEQFHRPTGGDRSCHVFLAPVDEHTFVGLELMTHIEVLSHAAKVQVQVQKVRYKRQPGGEAPGVHAPTISNTISL